MFMERIGTCTDPLYDIPGRFEQWFFIELLNAVQRTGLLVFTVGWTQKWADADNEAK